MIDARKVTDVRVQDVFMSDYPDFSDAYISYASYNGNPMTEAQLIQINKDYDFVNEVVLESLQ